MAIYVAGDPLFCELMDLEEVRMVNTAVKDAKKHPFSSN